MPSPTTSKGDYHNMNFEYDQDDETKANAPAPNDDDNASPNFNEPTSSTNSPPAASAPPPALSLPRKKSSIMGASSNLVNSIVGAGIIGIPYALRMSGLISGVALLLLVSVLTDKSLRLLIEQASFHPKLKNRNVHTFEELASYPFGQFGSGFVLFNMFLMAYGAMVAYLLIIKDTIPTVLGYEHGTHMLERNLIVTVTSLAVMVPLSMKRDMASLSCTSALSVFADMVLVVFIASFAPVRESVAEQGGFLQVLRKDGIQSTLFIGLGILSTAMACQHSAFIVANSLENKTRRRWRIVTNQSIGISAILCATLGVCGYLGFLGDTQGDVLNNFPLDSMQADAARVLLAFTMYVTYPMESFVARHVLIMLVHNGDMDARGGFTFENETQVEEIELAERRPRPDDEATVNTTNTNHTSGSVTVEGGGILCMNRRQSWTLTVYLMTLVPALIFSDIGPVLSLTGAVGGSCISYIGPGLVFLGVNGEAFLNKVGDWVERWRRAKGYSKSNESGIAESSDLPLEGNATLELPQDPNNVRGYEMILSGPKPCWYYMGLFPIWCSVAERGARHMKQKIDAFTLPPENENSTVDESKDVLPAPSNWDFFVAFFFVLFGMVSAVAGVISNVYVQWHNLDDADV
eukprot:CCRYP_000408-RB/>CCRYP_000408-RB protein AED:0.01 eAED:0.01 QI:77/1/1/1/1/0.6/5/1834/633